MPRIKPERAHYIPKGARRVQHKHSSAVAYIGRRAPDWLIMAAFHGRAQKPDLNYRYRDDESGRAQMERRINEHFAMWQKIEAESRVRKAKPRELEVGDILRASWGYDQTNIDFYEVVKLVGESMVEIREIQQARSEVGWAVGKCVPLPGQYRGDAMRKKADGDLVKIESYAYARKIEPQIIGGVPVYDSSNWSAYA